MMRSCCW